MGFVLLRYDFDLAGRARFIDSCLDLIDKSAELYARQPGIRQRDLDLLAFDMSPSEKYDNFARRLRDNIEDIPPERREVARLLIAGVVVHERLRQAREWLGFYEGFAGSVDAQSVDDFPPVNVRRQVTPEVYDRITAQSYPAHVDYALKTSDRVFLNVKTRDRFLRTTCNGGRGPIATFTP